MEDKSIYIEVCIDTTGSNTNMWATLLIVYYLAATTSDLTESKQPFQVLDGVGEG